MTSSYTDRLQELFRQHEDPENARQMKDYMRGLSDFYGIKSPDRRAILKAFLLENGYPEPDTLDLVVKEMWDKPHREFHYCALEILEKMTRHAEPERIVLYEYLILQKSWWDTVDFISPKLAGAHFRKYPDLKQPVTRRWIREDNFWLQRSAILFQLKYKKETDAGLLFDYIRQRAGENEFFVRKAIGWALREYSKTNPEAVREFVSETALSPLSRKEAMRVILKK
jgi:3-methyladenine DNA glycosylase AlkD